MIFSYLMSPAIWWVGLFLGFFVGWFIFAFREIRQAAPVAFHAAAEELAYLGEELYPLTTVFRNWGAEDSWFFLTVLGIFSPLISLMAIIVYTAIYHIVFPMVVQDIIGWGFLACWVANFIFIFVDNPSHLSRSNEVIRIYRRYTIFHGLLWPVYVPYRLIKLTPAGLQWMWVGMTFCGLFLWKLFVLVHSRERVLILTDGTLGAAVSYPTLVLQGGIDIIPALGVGFLVGGLFGVINFELISRRLLHIVPTT